MQARGPCSYTNIHGRSAVEPIQVEEEGEDALDDALSRELPSLCAEQIAPRRRLSSDSIRSTTAARRRSRAARPDADVEHPDHLTSAGCADKP